MNPIALLILWIKYVGYLIVNALVYTNDTTSSPNDHQQYHKIIQKTLKIQLFSVLTRASVADHSRRY